MPASLIAASHFLPILTTAISAAFAYVIFNRYAVKPGAWYLLWWGLRGR